MNRGVLLFSLAAIGSFIAAAALFIREGAGNAPGLDFIGGGMLIIAAVIAWEDRP